MMAGKRDSSGDEPSVWITTVGGCGYLLLVLLASTGMLLVNAIICLSIHSAIKTLGPDQIVNDSTFAPYIYQLLFFVVPVVLTIIQWNLYDRLNRIFGRR